MSKKAEVEEVTNNTEAKVRDLRDLIDEKDGLDKKTKALRVEIESVRQVLIGIMEEDGVDKISVDGVLALSLATDIHPSVENWDEFLGWVFENKAYEYLFKRINGAPYREALKEGMELPAGTDSYTKQTLRTRRLN